jgi:hypothetical protein
MFGPSQVNFTGMLSPSLKASLLISIQMFLGMRKEKG